MEAKELLAIICDSVILLGVLNAFFIALIYRIAKKGFHKVVKELLHGVDFLFSYIRRIGTSSLVLVKRLKNMVCSCKAKKQEKDSVVIPLGPSLYGLKHNIKMVIRDNEVKTEITLVHYKCSKQQK